MSDTFRITLTSACDGTTCGNKMKLKLWELRIATPSETSFHNLSFPPRYRYRKTENYEPPRLLCYRIYGLILFTSRQKASTPTEVHGGAPPLRQSQISKMHPQPLSPRDTHIVFTLYAFHCFALLFHCVALLLIMI